MCAPVLRLPKGLSCLRSTASEAVTRGKNTARVELAHVKGLVAALTEAAVDPVALQTIGGEYHG